jgi:hypothetical protein
MSAHAHAYHRTMRLGRTAVALVAVLVAASPAAAAAKTYAPPGKAGASEYFETLPASGGNVAPPNNHPDASGAALSKLGAATTGVHKLQKLGKDGQSAAAFAKATAPTVTAPVTASPTLSAASGGSAISGVAHLLGGSDGGGIGIFLPLLLAFGLAGAAAVIGLRVWRGRQPSA